MTVSTDFDPDAFLIVPARTFEDLRIGEVFRAPSRTLTDAHAAAFQTVSMDNHPVHYDAEWARTHGHVAPVVHGLQVLAFTAPGATSFPHFIGEVFISFLDSPAPSWPRCTPGTPLYPALTITGLEPKGDDGIVVTAVTVHNQRGQLVLSGQHKYLLRRQRAVRNGDG
jgi:acyl dehydratase